MCADVSVTDLTGDSHEYDLFFLGMPKSTKQEMVNEGSITTSLLKECKFLGKRWLIRMLTVSKIQGWDFFGKHWLTKTKL